MTAPGLSSRDGRTRVGVVAGVALLHVGALALLGMARTPPPLIQPMPTFDVMLMRPPPPPMATPAVRESGGGSPAAPSRIHTPPDPVLEKVELPAPRELAPQQAIVVGLAPIASPAPDLGQGGVGTGLGAGIGPGDGPSSGSGAGPVLIRGPAEAVITANVSRAALSAKPGAHVVLRCRIRLTQRLDECRVIGEYPDPSGFRSVALQRSQEFRFKPPVRNGRPRDRHRVTVAVAFPPEPEPAETPTPG